MRTVIILLLALVFGCASPRQGIEGSVVVLEGNQMPTIGGQPRNPPKRVAREILFYEPATQNDVTKSGPIYTDVRTKLVGTTKSDEQGNFRISLPDGEYSVFVRQDNGLFANIMDGEGRINVIKVEKGVFSKTRIQINHKAAF